MRHVTAAIAGGAALCLVAAGAYAQGQTPGWYVGGEAGWTHLEDPSFSAAPAPGTNFKIRPEEGFGLGVNGGYAFTYGLRLEGEIVYRSNDLKSATATTGAAVVRVPLTGNISSLAFMGNAYYDFLPNSVWTPYIGAGAGIARLSADSIQNSNNNAPLVNDSDVQFAYQGIAGVKYAINTNWSASLDYRYFATLDPSFKAAPALAGAATTVKPPYHTHNVFLGIAYHFAPPPPPPPAAQAAPAAAPAPAPPSQARTFLVFFDFDKATLTPEGARVVEQAAAAYKTTGSAKIDVNGYTDLAGSAQYNVGLSKRRADTVRAALQKAGVPNSAIVEAWHGKENPRVPTPDGVREPQNRRVEIMLP